MSRKSSSGNVKPDVNNEPLLGETDGRTGASSSACLVWCSQTGQRSLGGGHGLFINEGSVLVLSERAPKVGYLGAPSRHFGRTTLRDPQTLKVLENYSTYGVSPHDVRLLADKKHLAIANYGSTYPSGKSEYGLPRHIVEASVTLIDINDGKLVAKYLSGSSDKELYHVSAPDFDTIFAIRTDMGSSNLDRYFHEEHKVAYEADITVSKTNISYFPAPTLKKQSGSDTLMPLGSEKRRWRSAMVSQSSRS